MVSTNKILKGFSQEGKGFSMSNKLCCQLKIELTRHLNIDKSKNLYYIDFMQCSTVGAETENNSQTHQEGREEQQVQIEGITQNAGNIASYGNGVRQQHRLHSCGA